MNKIILDPHYCSREEYNELLESLSNSSWDFRQIESEPSPEYIDKLKNSLSYMTGLMEGIIQGFPNDGDKASDSQRICMLNALNDFSHTINGLEKEDLIIEDEQTEN